MNDRRRGIPVVAQVRNATLLGFLWLGGAIVLAAATLQSAVPIEELFLDPAYLSGRPWYTGLLSNVGVLAWTVAATAAGCAAWVSRLTSRPTAAFFLASGAMVTTVLLLDDLLALHSSVLPATGMRPGAAQMLVVAPAVVWAASNRIEIGRTRWLLLVGALGGFGVSLGADVIGLESTDTGLVVEDGAKLLGVLAWAQYFVMTAVDIIRSTVRDAQGVTARAWSVDSVGLRRDEAPAG